MGNNRDNFTEKTIREAAGRVGYRCSFPGCPNVTIGASMESSEKASVTGVAAHICAAAKGGPRYDSNMTADERKSIDNCIWLCQTHSKLIDTDEETYTVEKLHKWKSDAEKRASDFLANSDLISEYYNNNGENIVILEKLLEDMVIAGDFEHLKVVIDQYKAKLSEKYEELIARYKIVYCTYCDREKLREEIENYCKLICKKGINEIAELFFSFNMTKELKTIIDFCDDKNIIEYSNLLIDGKLENYLIRPIGSDAIDEIPCELSTMIDKYISNYIYYKGMFNAVDVSGKRYALYCEEFFYKLKCYIYDLRSEIVINNTTINQIINNEKFLFIKDNISKIKILNKNLQEYIWEGILSITLSDPALFNKYYIDCPDCVKSVDDIKRLRYMNEIKINIESIDIEDLIKFSMETNNYGILCFFLENNKKDKSIELLDEHSFLYKKDPAFLALRIDLAEDKENFFEFLMKYESIYSENFWYHCMLCNQMDKREDIDREINWLLNNQNKIDNGSFHLYLSVLRKNKLYDNIKKLYCSNMPNLYIYDIANSIVVSETKDNLNFALKLYNELILKKWKQKGLYFNMSVVQYKLGYLEDAKASSKTEYDEYCDLSALKYFIQIRYETHEYLIDDYLLKLEQCADAVSENLVAAVYMKNNSYNKARKHFLRSVLMNDENLNSLSGLFQAQKYEPNKEIRQVQADTVCFLKNDSGIIKVAIEPEDILKDINTPSYFAGCAFYSIENPVIAQLLFHNKNDTAVFEGEEYIIENIVPVNDIVEEFFFSQIMKSKDTKIITSSTAQEFLDKIKVEVKQSNDNALSIIKEYDSQDLHYPLSSLAYSLGRSMLVTYEFLISRNGEKIRNNISNINDKSEIEYVLSYDAVITLFRCGISLTDLKDLNIVCHKQVKNQLINDINEEIGIIFNSSNAGNMAYVDDKIAFLELTPKVRRDRQIFLSSLKAFVNSINTINEKYEFIPSNSNFKDICSNMLMKHRMLCEFASLSAAQKNPKVILVTDDQFLYETANFEKISNIGIIGLLISADLKWRKLLDVSKKLQSINFDNYLPLILYKKIIDDLITNEDDIQIGSEEVIKWLYFDGNIASSEHHQDLIIKLCQDVFFKNLDYLNPSNVLGNILLDILERRNPGFIKSTAEKMKSDMFKDKESL